jgi:hypothetical protein
MEDRKTELLRRVLEQMKKINGSDEDCVIKEWKSCSNHSLMHEIEEELKNV